MEPGLEEINFYDPENFVYPFGAHAAIVDVDAETGKVTLVRYVAVDDCGPAINPKLIDGQIHGGIAHGVGQALYEQVVYDETGQLVTGTFVDYALPTAAELPSFETDRTETRSWPTLSGWAMIALAGLIRLPVWIIAVIGLAMVAGHNLLDGIPADAFGAWAPLWTVLHAPGIVLNNGHMLVLISYVLVPWVGVTALGYVLGAAYRGGTERRKGLLLWLGIGLTLAFVALRFSNFYGDPSLWSPQKSPLWTAISFLNTSKYPPSLLFLLMTLGPILLLLRTFEDHIPDTLRPALIIGKVPLFFFLVHFFLIHLLAVAASELRYGRIGEMFQSPDLAHFPFSQPPGWGESLPVIYAIWLGVVLLMFPLCRWFARVKQQRKSWWLSYL